MPGGPVSEKIHTSMSFTSKRPIVMVKIWENFPFASNREKRKSNHFEIYTGKNHPFCDMSETQAGIKIAGRNINNLRYADDTTLMADSEEELKSLLMKVKEEN